MEGKSPDTVYDENLPTVIRKVTDNLTLNLICGKVVSRKVHNNGVKLFVIPLMILTENYISM